MKKVYKSLITYYDKKGIAVCEYFYIKITFLGITIHEDTYELFDEDRDHESIRVHEI